MVFKGFVVWFYLLFMLVLEVIELLVKVDDNEDDEVNVDLFKRCCRNFLIFMDVKNFFVVYFFIKKLKVLYKIYCFVIGLFVRYYDFVIGLLFVNV